MVAAQRVVLLGWSIFFAALAGAVARSPLEAQDRFPHPAHARLFPLCAGCHPAAMFDDGNAMYPAASLCGNCHDGTARKRVRWTTPTAVPSAFRHVNHSRSTRSAGKSLECTDCHPNPDVARPGAGAVGLSTACAGCHTAHKESNCRMCHAPASAGHEMSAHAGCDVCHKDVRIDSLPLTRDFCLLCHQELKDHAAPRNCVECHPMGRDRVRVPRPAMRTG